MKLLSQMTNDEAASALCVVAPCIQNMAEDAVLVAELQKTIPADVNSQIGVYRFWVVRIAVLVPIILRDHKADLYSILATFCGTSADEIGKQNLMETMSQVKELLNDRAFVDFFKSSFGMGQKA